MFSVTTAGSSCCGLCWLVVLLVSGGCFCVMRAVPQLLARMQLQLHLSSMPCSRPLTTQTSGFVGDCAVCS